METAFVLSFAGLSFRIDAPEPEWSQRLQERYQAFLADEAAADWRIALRHAPDLPQAAADWARHEATRTEFHIASYRGRVDFATRRAQVLTPDLQRAPSALARTITFIATVILPREKDGLLLHACGLASDAAAFAFCGPSGAGKSTIARLAPPALQPMSDENVIVRLSEAGPILYSTPFWGRNTPETSIRRQRIHRPLKAAFILKQSPRWSLRPLAPSQAILALLATEKVAVERTPSAQAWLDIASRLLAQTPIFELGFLPAPELWSFLAEQGFPIPLSSPESRHVPPRPSHSPTPS